MSHKSEPDEYRALLVGCTVRPTLCGSGMHTRFAAPERSRSSRIQDALREPLIVFALDHEG